MKDDDYLVTMSSYVIYVTASYICPWCFYQTWHDITKLIELSVNFKILLNKSDTKQVARWATIAHNGASKMFVDTIIYDAQRHVTLNLKQ